MRASVGKRANASRTGAGPVSARVVSAWVKERPAAIDAPRSRSPSGHAIWSSRIFAARRRPKYARGIEAAAIAGTIATSAVPVTKNPNPNATMPTASDPTTNCGGVTPRPAWASHSSNARADDRLGAHDRKLNG
jgi:hypothetical protein